MYGTESIPRPEYPRPQLVRARWRNLNGPWEFALDPGDRGLREGWEHGRRFGGRVVVPYPPGSALSRATVPDPPPPLWYRRTVRLPAEDLAPRQRLHIGACDFATTVFVNGREIGRHRGGYTPIACEVGHALHAGENEVVLRVEDPDTWTQPRGKQATSGLRTPIDYDAVIGVWQTVWLEPLPEVSIDEVWTRWSAATGELAVHAAFSSTWHGDVEVVLRDGADEIARAHGGAGARGEARVVLRIPAPRLWSPRDPHLYRLDVGLSAAGLAGDRVESYCGLRDLAVADRRLLLNGAPLYVRGVLDQGYFPGGWYAAAADADLRRDVELVRALGFNCARKHQKIEDPRWLYWADRLGLLVWAEMPSGRDFTTTLAEDLTHQWCAALRRDRAHPCVMAWVPCNESWGVWQQARRPEERALVEGLTGLTRALDPSRFVVGNDGWEYAAGDLWTLHLYEGEGVDIGSRLARLLADPHSPILPAAHVLGERVGALPGTDVSRLPVLLSECGGVGYTPPDAPAADRVPFAYGALPASADELEARIRRVTSAVDGCRELSGFVWTQLTDVQQEINGLLTFDRRPKLPPSRLREIFAGVGGDRG
jgi:Glycosyl hydrolases family 2, sugar binding domain/Glycosyl hydrolases family 2, TIM barrel domain/Glycosyl hydrolases family 2